MNPKAEQNNVFQYFKLLLRRFILICHTAAQPKYLIVMDPVLRIIFIKILKSNYLIKIDP